MIKLVGAIRLKPLSMDTRLKYTVFSGIGRCVKGINVYVSGYVYSQLTAKHNHN